MRLLRFVLLCIVFYVCASIVPFGDEDQTEMAHFALRELAKLSDSGVYSTLSLSRVLSYREEDGLFHQNHHLSLELASPYFASKLAVESFEMIVMVHKDDGVKSFAIDEFPVMDEAAIESFWISKVEEKRGLREEAFRKLEIESLLMSRADLNSPLDERALEIKEMVGKQSVAQMIEELDSPIYKQQRDMESTKRRAQLAGYAGLQAEEQELSNMSLSELYAITIGERETASDYQISRAKSTLDKFFLKQQQQQQR